MRTTGTRRRAGGQSGFSLVEVAITLIIASVLIGLAVPRIQSTVHQRDVDGVRNSVMLLASKARARAMEHATTVQFQLDTSTGMARIVENGTAIEVYSFLNQHGVEARSAVPQIVMCYTARGFAVEPCSTALAGPTEVVFSRLGYTAALEVWQLGQLRKL